ncbi:ATP-binding protein [Vibrio sp. JC009]|uniref:sensor histidine kinase n=1 Tax=Vibrio sp. JC009 TaxID=2912314 RepID=UPI0023B20351|nr:ATP-binding protein [Vibrio sp. JC009]WED23627.1 ATP-binding protein [Vibrio sp. JC009]
MRRIYLESIFGLIACFMTSLILYEVTVYHLNTDYEYLLQDYEAQAYQELAQNIADNQGLEAAHQAINRFAQTARSTVTIYTEQDSLPDDVTVYFADFPGKTIYHDEDRLLWFRLAQSQNVYFYQPDEQALIHRKIELEENLLWGFFLFAFMAYGIGHLFIIFRRVRHLEQATLHFSEGDFSVRAQTGGGKAIGTLNHSFNLMADRISQLIESNRSLTNAVAHELRTPVFRIQWQAELLKDSRLDAVQNEKIDSIIEDTEEMEQMIDELLHYARLERGQLQLDIETIHLNDYFNKAIHRWSKESTLPIESMLTTQVMQLEADKKLLGRALDNLVRNAFKFAKNRVLIKIKEAENNVYISIHDDGPGVAKEHREHLFDPFYIADKSRSKSKSGYGLGLSIVKKICEQHNGSIQVGDSEALGGAEFSLQFPVCNTPGDKSLQ